MTRQPRQGSQNVAGCLPAYDESRSPPRLLDEGGSFDSFERILRTQVSGRARQSTIIDLYAYGDTYL